MEPIVLLLGAGALYALTRKKKKAPSFTGKVFPKERATGWAVNELCSNGDLMDVAQAVKHAQGWSEKSGLLMVPIPAAEADPSVLEDFHNAIAARVDMYFADTFPQCNRAPDGFLFGTTASSVPDAIQATVASLTGPGRINEITDVITAIAGH